MKNKFSIEFKIIFAATVVMLALITAVVANQLSESNNNNVTFVYNSIEQKFVPEINISDIFGEERA